MNDTWVRIGSGFLFWTVIVSAPFPLGAPTLPAQQPHSSSMTSKPTPQILSVEGTVMAVDLKPPVRTLKLISSRGRNVVLVFDAKGAPVWHNGRQMEAFQLKQGALVRVRYLHHEDKNVIKSIELLEEAED